MGDSAKIGRKICCIIKWINLRNISYLDELSNYIVAADDYDVRGWKVKDADNLTIGKVDDLLVNKKAERVVYLDVDVDKSLLEDEDDTDKIPAVDGAYGFMNKDGDNHLIIPIGMVRLDEENKN
ncbi:MAG: PRC-barrel domain-containing protein, partial [Nitrososphaeraceae archaeon]|nr:PRC-barrel domain-containing protein [Nitrososphaeraceae archaeon]